MYCVSSAAVFIYADVTASFLHVLCACLLTCRSRNIRAVVLSPSPFLTLRLFPSLDPAGHRHQPRFVSRDGPNPRRGVRLAGGGHPVGLLSGHQHPGRVDVPSPAGRPRRRHLAVLPRAASSHVSVSTL